MKLIKVECANYKSFEKLALSEPLAINMIFGYNNSGKSNILRFLDLLFHSRYEIEKVSTVNTRNQPIIQSRKINRSFWEGLVTDVPYIFHVNNKGVMMQEIPFDVEVELSETDLKQLGELFKIIEDHILKGKKVLSIKLKGKLTKSGLSSAEINLLEVSFNEIIAYSKPEGEAVKYFIGQDQGILTNIHFSSVLNLLNDSVLFLDNDRFFSEESDDQDNILITHENFKSFIFNLSLNDERNQEYLKLLNFLTKFKLASGDAIFNNSERNNPFNLAEFKFEFIRANDTIEIMLNNGKKRLPLSAFGTGIQQLIYQLTRIFLSGCRIVLIEEFELNFSPKYQLCILDYFNSLIENNIIDQLFFTTHSPVLSYRTENRTIQVRIDENGLSTVENITPNGDEVKALREAQHLLSHFHPSKII